nr:glycoside hydrolase family 2 TIM barrel-domain containing protein [uncultured Bacteroides sp.]
MNRALILITFLSLLSLKGLEQQTERHYLSGTGLGNTVTWQFRCSEGRNCGKWSKIEVPSQWELQGFGEYTYGRWYKKKGIKNPSMEEGIYRRTFKVPATWRNKVVRIWFDGVMTDADVLINGASAGETHRGGFYRFSYDITSLLKYGGTNKIEVRVKKHSDNKSVNAAERKADWWLFGGIYRPVWLEAKPKPHIEHFAVDARADGLLEMDLRLQGTTGKENLAVSVAATGNPEEILYPKRLETTGKTRRWQFCGIKPWTPETPHLYNLTLSLLDENGVLLHRAEARIGFRTVEFRERDGLYLNGTKLVMKGINRHSFHPEGGRTTNKDISIQDALLIKEMNMNAVRSHYPPDEHFLDVCDSLGLLYIDELAGWQNAYDDEAGGKLVKEMVERDVNHPCIVLWSNGNEGGWNEKIEPGFWRYDPQRRHVIHPWADYNELDTHHYPAYLTGVGRFTNGYKVFMPTEFMHGQYDQGHGAGLEDFWARYTAHPLFAGGFMWAYCDETVRRTDKGGAMDSEDYNAPDGIVGAYREKEGSFYSVREVWSPIQILPLMVTCHFNGRFLVKNNYLFTGLRQCSMRYRMLRCPSPLTMKGAQQVQVLDSGLVELPDILPGETGTAFIPVSQTAFSGSDKADILELEAYGPDGKSLCTRTFPVRMANEYFYNECHIRNTHPDCSKTGYPDRKIEENDSLITLCSHAVTVSFRRSDGAIARIIRHKDEQELPFKDGPLPVGMKMELTSMDAGCDEAENTIYIIARYRGGVDKIVWTLYSDGTLEMDALLLNRASGGGGFDDAFVDTEVLNFGFTFSYSEDECKGMRWLGRGPYRVWKNRIPGTNYGIWQKDYNNTITGEPKQGGDGYLQYPEFKGYHANLYWTTLQSDRFPFTVYSMTDGLFFRVFTPEEPHGRQDGINTMPEFPSGELSFLLDIPAIRSFKPISQHGPQSQPGIIRIKKGDEGIRVKLMFDFR